LEIAENVTHCLSCGKFASGGICAAHSNQLRDGKGRGIKAHDYRVAYVCGDCHREIDEGKGSREEKQEKWEQAHRKTVAYWFEESWLSTK